MRKSARGAPLTVLGGRSRREGFVARSHHPAKRALGAPRDPRDHDPTRLVMDDIDDTEVADAKPEVASSHNRSYAGRARLEREAQDGAPEPGAVVRSELADFARGCSGESDVIRGIA